jgi:hypothetical protein
VLALVSLLFLSGAAAQSAVTPPKIASPEVAAKRVKACGFEHVRVKNDPELQEDVVEVSALSDAPQSKLHCVAQVSLDTITYVEFPKPVNDAYQRLYIEMERDHGQQEARGWLQQRGLLSKLPTYQKGRDDDLQFAREIENVCGPKAKGVFVRLDGHVTLNFGSPEKPTVDKDTAECLFNAMWASGMPFGFVGNEYYEER